MSQEPLRNNSSTSNIKVEADFNGDSKADNTKKVGFILKMSN